jgi:negative modulator of initiation of replication
MKTIEIDDELYHYIAQNTQYIGESASSILRRLLALAPLSHTDTTIVSTEDKTKHQSTETVKTEQSEHTKASLKTAYPSDSVFNYIDRHELATQRGATGRFLLILSALYRAHSKDFSVVLSIRGRDRLYFADNEAALAESGNSTKPKQIPDSPYWVMTNSNTIRKKLMLTEAATLLGYSAQEVEKIRDLL